MRNGMKRLISAVLAAMTAATLAVTAFAADYAGPPVFSDIPSQTVSVSNSELKEAVNSASEGAVSVTANSVKTLSVSATVMKALDKADAVLEIVAPKATVTIDASTIKNTRKLDLSMKVYSSAKRAVVKMRSKKDFGCEVKIALTNCKGSSLAELLLGDTYRVGKLTAESVDLLDVLLRYGGCAVQNYRESGDLFHDLLENIKAERGRNEDTLFVSRALLGRELICAVGGTDSNSEGVNTGLGNELLNLLGTGVGGILGGNRNLVLNAGQRAQLGLDGDTMIVSVLNDLLGDLNILSKGLGRGVDHNGSKAAIDTALTGLEAVTMIQMQRDGQAGFDNGSLNELSQVGVVGIGAGTLGNLQDQGSLDFQGGLGDALNNFHVVDVESADGVAALISLLKHLSSVDQWHSRHSFKI